MKSSRYGDEKLSAEKMIVDTKVINTVSYWKNLANLKHCSVYCRCIGYMAMDIRNVELLALIF